MNNFVDCINRNIAILARQVRTLSTTISTKIKVGLTTTLPPGSPATVTNSGTDTDVVLNFGIPQGIPGGTNRSIHSSFYGIMLNDVDQPSTVNSGASIPWKVLTNNDGGLITPTLDNSYFQFTKTGRYMATFSLRCATKTSGENGVITWGLLAQFIKKAMVTSASAFVTQNMTNISGVGVFDVTDLNERYNFINNSKVSIQVQGATSAQVFINAFKDLNGVNMIDGMSCVFIRLGDAIII